MTHRTKPEPGNRQILLSEPWQRLARSIFFSWSKMTAEEAEQKLSRALFDVFREKFPEKFPVEPETKPAPSQIALKFKPRRKRVVKTQQKLPF